MSTYTPYYPVWEDEPDHDTLVSAAALNHMEAGIIAANVPVEAGSSIEYENAWAAGTAYTPGDVVRHNGIDYIAVNPSTGQTPAPAAGSGIGTSLPASPTDGMEFVLVDSLTAPTYSWRFRYVAAKASNKWVFIGGSPKVVEVVTQENITSTSFADAATDGPSFAIPIAGDYDVRGEANVTIASGTATVTVGTFANAVEIRGMPWYLAAGGGGAYGLGRAGGSITVSALAGHIVKLRYKTTGGTAQFSLRRLEIRPVAVGG